MLMIVNRMDFSLTQIVAVIMCDTGIALLAYMDGITGSPTLGGVVLAVLAAAGYAVFKVRLYFIRFNKGIEFFINQTHKTLQTD